MSRGKGGEGSVSLPDRTGTERGRRVAFFKNHISMLAAKEQGKKA